MSVSVAHAYQLYLSSWGKKMSTFQVSQMLVILCTLSVCVNVCVCVTLSVCVHIVFVFECETKVLSAVCVSSW